MKHRTNATALIALLVLTVFVLASCNNNPQQDMKGTAMLSLDVSISGIEKPIQMSGYSPDTTDIWWSYTLKPVGASGASGAVEDETPIAKGENAVTAQVSYGHWTAEVWGYRDADYSELVYHGVGQTATPVGKGGGTITIQATTSKNASDAHAMSADNHNPKNTADLIIKPIGTSSGVIPEGTKAEWSVNDGNARLLETWTYTGGKWIDANSAEVPESGKIYFVAPGAANELSVKLTDAAGNLVGHEGWVASGKIPMALNCVYTVDGSVEVRNDGLSIQITVDRVNFTGLQAQPIED